jgi:hypothetical protein
MLAMLTVEFWALCGVECVSLSYVSEMVVFWCNKCEVNVMQCYIDNTFGTFSTHVSFCSYLAMLMDSKNV